MITSLRVKAECAFLPSALVAGWGTLIAAQEASWGSLRATELGATAVNHLPLYRLQNPRERAHRSPACLPESSGSHISFSTSARSASIYRCVNSNDPAQSRQTTMSTSQLRQPDSNQPVGGKPRAVPISQA